MIIATVAASRCSCDMKRGRGGKRQREPTSDAADDNNNGIYAAVGDRSVGGTPVLSTSIAVPPNGMSIQQFALSTYSPGCMLDDGDLLLQARRVAKLMGGKLPFEGAEAAAEADQLAVALADVSAQVVSAEAAVSQSPGDHEAVTTLREARAASEDLARRAAAAWRVGDAQFRAALREAVIRVAAPSESDSADGRGDVVSGPPPPRLVCASCGNADEGLFVSEYRSGDVTCARCGTVAMQHTQFDGDWARSFEGEANASQIGDRPNPLLSNAANLRTAMRLSAGVSKARLRQLQLVQDVVEMNTSSAGTGMGGGGGTANAERRTREGYKDRQKQRAFERISSVAERLRVAEGVVERARALFAAFRDAREHVTALDDTLTGCLVAAMEEAAFLRAHAAAQQRDEARVLPSSSTAPLSAATAATGAGAAPSAGGMATASVQGPVKPADGVSDTAVEPPPSRAFRADMAPRAIAASAAAADPKTAKALQEREAIKREAAARRRAALVTGRMMELPELEGDADDADGVEDYTASHRGFERFSVAGFNAGGGADAPPPVSDAFVDDLYARAGERETNIDIEEREEYRAPS